MKIIHIHRYLSGESTPEEKKVLESWLERSEKNQNLFESYRKIYDVEIQHMYEYDTEEALARFRRVMHENKKGYNFFSPGKTGTISLSQARKRQAGMWWKVVALLLIAVGLKDVLKQLELHFNVAITVDDLSTIEDRVTSSYRNESLGEFLEYTSITLGVNFKVAQP